MKMLDNLNLDRPIPLIFQIKQLMVSIAIVQHQLDEGFQLHVNKT